MSTDDLRRAVDSLKAKDAGGFGNVTLATVRAIAETGWIASFRRDYPFGAEPGYSDLDF